MLPQKLLPAALILVACLLSANAVADPGSPDSEVQRLVRALGSGDFATREEATKALSERDDTEAELRKALKSPDREVARRAAMILEALEARQTKDVLAKLRGQLKDKRLDLAVELLQSSPVWCEDGRRLDPFTMHFRDLANTATAQFGDKLFPPVADPQIPLGEFARWDRLWNPPKFFAGVDAPKPEDGRPRLLGAVASGNRMALAVEFKASLLFARDELQAPRLAGCVVYSGGGVELQDDAHACVIVCDGPFSAKRANASLIVASGPVRIKEAATNCRIVTASTVSADRLPGTQSKENDPTLAKLTKFFDPADEGLVLKAVDRRPAVKELTEGKRFAKTDLKPGDVVARVDGKAVETPDQLRRLLRTRIALGEPFTLNVLRGDNKVDVPVK